MVRSNRSPHGEVQKTLLPRCRASLAPNDSRCDIEGHRPSHHASVLWPVVRPQAVRVPVTSRAIQISKHAPMNPAIR
jgi:hypothetical protein